MNARRKTMIRIRIKIKTRTKIRIIASARTKTKTVTKRSVDEGADISDGGRERADCDEGWASDRYS